MKKDGTMDQALWKSMNIAMEYYIVALLLMLGTGVVCFYRKRNISVSIAWAFLIAYLFLIYSSTVITRDAKAEYDYEFQLFWSYIKIWKEEKVDLLYLNIANVIMLLPVGFLAGCIGVTAYKWAMLIGIGISGVIEVSQLILKRGLFEFDDIFHNALGCVLGYLVYRGVKRVREKKNSYLTP